RITEVRPTGVGLDLSRRLGMLDATAIVVGIVIGSGIFVLPNLIARNLPSSVAILTAWIVSGVLSFFGALAYAELGAMMPATGGQYVYLREAYGPRCAFVCAWTFMLAVLSGGSAWLAVTFSIYAGYFVTLTPAMSKVMSIALIAVLSAVNYVGVREGAWVQRTFTYLKVAALLALIGAAFLTPQSAHADHGLDWRSFCIADCSAFDCRGRERVHSDGCPYPVRPSSGSAVFRQLRGSPSPV